MVEGTTILDCEYLHHTDDAILCDFGYGEQWVPRSVGTIEGMLDLARGDATVIVVQIWFATKKGLICIRNEN